MYCCTKLLIQDGILNPSDYKCVMIIKFLLQVLNIFGNFNLWRNNLILSLCLEFSKFSTIMCIIPFFLCQLVQLFPQDASVHRQDRRLPFLSGSG